MMDSKRYDQLWHRIFNHPNRERRIAAHVALALAAGKPVRTIRARAGAGAFERADYATARRMAREVANRVLARAAECSRKHGDVAREFESQYGGQGPVISAVVRDHWPSNVKDRLRRLARAASGSRFAYELIRATGQGLGAYRKAHDRHVFGFYG